VKAILIIADGMADVPLKELGTKTPLEVAQKPSLNHIAKAGICGMIDVIAPGIPPGSDTAHLALLGYDVMEVYSGRGALEAIGSGIDILPNDLAFRCNFATVDAEFKVLDRRAGRIRNEDAAKLTASIKESIQKAPPEIGSVLFENTIQHRAILRISGPNLSTMVSDTDPHETGLKVLKAHSLDGGPEAKNTATMLNELTLQFHKVLRDHPVNKERKGKGLLPANVILFRGVGQLPEIDPLTLLYGIHPAAIAAVPLVRGVCKAAGMKLISVPGALGTYETDLIAKAKAALKALQSFDFVLVHFKATDLASHDYEPQKKIEMIEKADAMVSHLLNHLNLDETFITVTADHTTSSIKKDHSGEPVPVAIMGPNVRTDDVKEYGERTCAKGGLNRIKGLDLMPILINFLGKAEKAGS
jgi:2,3-bisphosphoglycerate-independent phosphoglycerate mutase